MPSTQIFPLEPLDPELLELLVPLEPLDELLELPELPELLELLGPSSSPQNAFRERAHATSDPAHIPSTHAAAR